MEERTTGRVKMLVGWVQRYTGDRAQVGVEGAETRDRLPLHRQTGMRDVGRAGDVDGENKRNAPWLARR